MNGVVKVVLMATSVSSALSIQSAAYSAVAGDRAQTASAKPAIEEIADRLIDPGWIDLPSAGQVLHVRGGSLDLAQYANSNEYFASAIIRFRSGDKGQIVSLFTIPLAVCDRGHGVVGRNSLDGELLDRLNYVRGAGTLASNIGDLLCRSAAQELSRQAGNLKPPAQNASSD